MAESERDSTGAPPNNVTRKAPGREDLFAAVESFVADARTAYERVVDEDGYIPSMSRMPTNHGPFSSGFPHITQAEFTKVPDYAALFGLRPAYGKAIAYGDWDSFKALCRLVGSDARLREYFATGPEPENSADEIAIGFAAVGLFERAMHVHGRTFTREHLLAVYLLVEKAILEDRLPVMFVAPAVLTHCEIEIDEPVEMSTGVFVTRLSDEMNLARMPDYPTGAPVNDLVLSAATHAVVLYGWTIPHRHFFDVGPDGIDAYPTSAIDRFFDALRTVTGLDTGYAQVFMVPFQWARRFRANLPPIVRGYSVRRYPSRFEDGGWSEPRPVVSTETLTEVAALFQALSDDRPPLELAARRLSMAMLRDSESDSILDLVIGLEALLGDQSSGEVTYKLALRTAAVLSQVSSAPVDPVEVFESVKRIYGYRSAVAHGNEKRARKLGSTPTESGETTTSELAAHYLRGAIRYLASRPELKGGNQIDLALVLPALRDAASR